MKNEWHGMNEKNTQDRKRRRRQKEAGDIEEKRGKKQKVMVVCGRWRHIYCTIWKVGWKAWAKRGKNRFSFFLNEAIAVPLSIANSIKSSRPFLHSSSLWLTSGMRTDFSEKIFGGCARPVPSPRHISGFSHHGRT